MATEKLLRAIVSGSVDKTDDAIRTLILNREFHLLTASEALKPLKGLRAFSDPNPYEAYLNTALSILSKFGIRPAFMEFESRGYALGDCGNYLSRVGSACTRIITHKNAEESLASGNKILIERLARYSELEADIAELFTACRLDIRFGHVDPEDYPGLAEAADKDPGAFLFRTGKDERWIYCVYMALLKNSDHAVEEFQNLGFVFEEKPDETGLTGIPRERMAELDKEAADAGEKAAALSAELHAMADAERSELLSRYSWLLFMNRAFELRSYVGYKGGRFYFTGWLPEKNREEFESEAIAMGLDCVLEKPVRADIMHAPSKFTTGFVSKIFSPFVKMYGYPAYGELDPRVFMTITYALLFGMMFGDIGQGAVLVLFGLFLAVRKKSWLGNIMACVGVSSIIFGFVYGSVFGSEHLLPGFKVMEAENMTTTLGIAVAVGFLIIIACVVMNVITGFRQHDIKKAVFSANGIVGGILYIAIAAALASTLLLGKNLFTLPYLIGLVIVPVVLLFCGEPLAKLIEGRGKWLPESWGMFFIEGFFDLFEAALSWMSNTVSFLRVGAYAICHAGMMMVVYLLSTTSHGTAIWGVVLGNILVMTIEAVLVCIQVLRLEFYEMFGRFYSGTGSPFTPQTVDYARAAVKS